ncbi:hypothetical protein [Robinsoniella peoriensis]|uniref:hypothetical protein n=1 Tax=Robinsoniella peoriensis TaxID=180332 RepID=UPI00085BB191|nr:hypothetical protein [Robinsoniella peoriensis]MDU7031277.1 hypothetical protein [Clostridiales bacterium]
MYAAIIDEMIHYSIAKKEGYQELKGSSSIPQQAEEELRNQISALQEQQDTTDAAVQELILATMEA